MKKFMRELLKVDLRMLKIPITLLGCILLFFTLCKGQQNNLESKSNSLQLIVEDNYGGSELEEILVLRNQKDLMNYFSILNRSRKPGFPVPEIDFTKEMVIAWSPGEMNDNSQLQIKSVNNKNLIVEKRLIASKNLPTTVIRPIHIYKLPTKVDSVKIE